MRIGGPATSCSISPRSKPRAPRTAKKLRTTHLNLVGELRPPGHRRVLLIGGDLAERLAFGKGHLARQRDIELAAGRRADKLRRLLLGEFEVDENARVVD